MLSCRRQCLLHPAQPISDAERRIGLDAGALVVDNDSHARVDTPDGDVQVYLARFTAIDPPFETVENIDGKFIAIREAHGSPPVEMELHQQACVVVMEGLNGLKPERFVNQKWRLAPLISKPTFSNIATVCGENRGWLN